MLSLVERFLLTLLAQHTAHEGAGRAIASVDGLHYRGTSFFRYQPSMLLTGSTHLPGIEAEVFRQD